MRFVREVSLLAGVVVGGVLLPEAVSAQSSTQTYSYDALGRLIEVDVSGGSEDGSSRDYSYDAAGNRTNVTSDSEAAAPTPSCTIALLDRHANLVQGVTYTRDFAIISASGDCAGKVLYFSTQDGTGVSSFNYNSAVGSMTLSSNPAFDLISISGIRLNGAYSFNFHINISSSDSDVLVQDGQVLLKFYDDNV